jgi:hypothetical protein
MTNDQSKGLSETPEVVVPDLAVPGLPDANVARTSFGEQTTVARDIMRQRRAALRELAT